MKFQIEFGRYKSSYYVRWTFDKEGQAILYYNGLNVGYGYKKRLKKDGKLLQGDFMNHSQSAIDNAKGSTWDLDDYAERHGWDGVSIAYGIHRDSDVIYRSNWEVFLEEFRNHFSDEDFDVAHLGHWAVGWVRHLCFNTANENIAKLADDFKEKLEDYPVLDEELYSNMEWEENHPMSPTGDNKDGDCYSENEDCPCMRKKA